jgi:hypothetical protein
MNEFYTAGIRPSAESSTVELSRDGDSDLHSTDSWDCMGGGEQWDSTGGGDHDHGHHTMAPTTAAPSASPSGSPTPDPCSVTATECYLVCNQLYLDCLAGIGADGKSPCTTLYAAHPTPPCCRLPR